MLNGETLKLVRSWKGFAQKEAASLLGISQPAYSKWEKKKSINSAKWIRILTAFKLTRTDLEIFITLKEKK